MSGSHRILIIEDSPPMVEDLGEILKSLGFEFESVDNKRDALAAIAREPFCCVLLDLEIKEAPQSIRGHAEHGRSLLREIRARHPEHTGKSHWLPMLIVSGHASEVDEAVAAMRDGANDVIQKPFRSNEVSQRLRENLATSGRVDHAVCATVPPGPARVGKLVISIPPGADGRQRRRTRVMFGRRPVDLTDGNLKVLLHLMIAHVKGETVHKLDIGGQADRGFKNVSRLRDAVQPALSSGESIIENHYGGEYALADDVEIGQCDLQALMASEAPGIAQLARSLREAIDALRQESDGTS